MNLQFYRIPFLFYLPPTLFMPDIIAGADEAGRGCVIGPLVICIASIEEEKEDREANKLPQKKWEYIVYLNDPEGKITGDFDAWIATYLEGTDAATVLQKLRDGAKEQNEAAKRKKNKLTTLGEVFQGIKTKFIKDKGVKVKTKESVRVVPVNGKLF